MKIVCDNCATKYSIADEKVRGKVFKIRCKKCSHIIVVRGGADGNVAPARDEGATRRTDSADLFAGAGSNDDAASDAPSGDLFGGAPAPAYSSAPAPAAEVDVFGGGGGGGGLFGAPSASPAPRASRTS